MMRMLNMSLARVMAKPRTAAAEVLTEGCAGKGGNPRMPSGPLGSSMDARAASSTAAASWRVSALHTRKIGMQVDAQLRAKAGRGTWG